MKSISINNFSGFYNFLNKSKLSGTEPFLKYTKEVEKYISICACDRESERQSLADLLKKSYESLAKNQFSTHAFRIKNELGISTLKFFSNGTLIAKY